MPRIKLDVERSGVTLPEGLLQNLVRAVLESEEELSVALGIEGDGLAFGRDLVGDAVHRYELRVQRVLGAELGRVVLRRGLGSFAVQESGIRAFEDVRGDWSTSK
jgi:hypothetical protein